MNGVSRRAQCGWKPQCNESETKIILDVTKTRWHRRLWRAQQGVVSLPRTVTARCVQDVHIDVAAWCRLDFAQQSTLLHAASQWPNLLHFRLGRQATRDVTTSCLGDTGRATMALVNVRDLTVLIQNVKLQSFTLDAAVRVYYESVKDVDAFIMTLARHACLTRFTWQTAAPVRATMDDGTLFLHDMADSIAAFATKLIEALITHCRIESLTLEIPGGAHVDATTLTRFVAATPCLSHLALWTNDWKAVGQGLVQRRHATLTSLHLTQDVVTANDAMALSGAWGNETLLPTVIALSTRSAWNGPIVQPLLDALATRHDRVHLVLQSQCRSGGSTLIPDELPSHCQLCCTALQGNFNLTVTLDEQNGTGTWQDMMTVCIQSRLNQVGRGYLLRGDVGNATNDKLTFQQPQRSDWVRALEQIGSTPFGELPMLSSHRENDKSNDVLLLQLNCTFELLRLNPTVLKQ